MTSARSAAAVVLMLLAGAGCVQQGTSPETVVQDRVPTDHWIVQDDPADKMTVAMVFAFSHDDYFHVGCDDREGHGDRGLYMRIYPRGPLPATVQYLVVSLAFDDGPPILGGWRSSAAKVGSYGKLDFFEIKQGIVQFRKMIDAMMRSRQMDVTISDAGTEVQRQTFTLNGAPAALGEVFKACNKAL